MQPETHQAVTRRSPLARARDAFIESDEGKKLCEPTTLRAPPDVRQYLTNRIKHAFIAGVEAGRLLPKD